MLFVIIKILIINIQIVDEKDSTFKEAIIILSLKDLACYSIKAEIIPIPKHVVLFHELTHAYHYLSGKRANTILSDCLVWKSDEEYKTIMGFPSKKKKTTPKITENAFRKVENLPERLGSYAPLDDSKEAKMIFCRMKKLAKIDEQNRKIDPENLSPPAIALCRMNDLGIDSHVRMWIKIRGVDENFKPQQNKKSIFYVKDSENILSPILRTDTFYIDIIDSLHSLNQSDKINDVTTCFIPQLKDLGFEVKIFKILRLS